MKKYIKSLIAMSLAVVSLTGCGSLLRGNGGEESNSSFPSESINNDISHYSDSPTPNSSRTPNSKNEDGKYEIIFHSGKGEFNDGSDEYIQYYQHDEQISFEGNNPTLNGFRFVGWYIAPNCPDKVVDTSYYYASTGVEFYAVYLSIDFTWFQITFVGNGGVYVDEVPDYMFFVAEGETLDGKDILIPTRRGYHFIEEKEGFPLWYMPNQEKLYLNTPIYDNYLVAPDWELTEYSITYDLDGGVNSSSNPTSYNINDSIQLQPATKAGTTFIEWRYKNQRISYINGLFAEDLILTAIYGTGVRVDVVIIGDGKVDGFGTYKLGDMVVLTVDDKHYPSFHGFYSDYECTDLLSKNQSYVIHELKYDLTIYALFDSASSPNQELAKLKQDLSLVTNRFAIYEIENPSDLNTKNLNLVHNPNYIYMPYFVDDSLLRPLAGGIFKGSDGMGRAYTYDEKTNLVTPSEETLELYDGMNICMDFNFPTELLYKQPGHNYCTAEEKDDRLMRLLERMGIVLNEFYTINSVNVSPFETFDFGNRNYLLELVIAERANPSEIAGSLYYILETEKTLPGCSSVDFMEEFMESGMDPNSYPYDIINSFIDDALTHKNFTMRMNEMIYKEYQDGRKDFNLHPEWVSDLLHPSTSEIIKFDCEDITRVIDDNHGGTIHDGYHSDGRDIYHYQENDGGIYTNEMVESDGALWVEDRDYTIRSLMSEDNDFKQGFSVINSEISRDSTFFYTSINRCRGVLNDFLKVFKHGKDFMSFLDQESDQTFSGYNIFFQQHENFLVISITKLYGVDAENNLIYLLVDIQLDSVGTTTVEHPINIVH